MAVLNDVWLLFQEAVCCDDRDLVQLCVQALVFTLFALSQIQGVAVVLYPFVKTLSLYLAVFNEKSSQQFHSTIEILNYVTIF